MRKQPVHLGLLFFFLFFSIILKAQDEDLRKDSLFFEQQSQVYQRWLDHSGLGQYLSVQEIYLESDLLLVNLKFPYADIDSITSAWEILKANFEATASISLEQQLYYKAEAIMEVEADVLGVQVLNTYDGAVNPVFARRIYFDDGIVQLIKEDPRDKRRAVNLKPQPTSSGKTASVEEFKKRYSKEFVFDCIYNYARKRFEQEVCEDRHPRVRLRENQEVLRFEVSDLCREVLTDEANPSLCSFLSSIGYKCNWAKRELLNFTISYEETMSGFRLIVLIDGKYGSGFYDTLRRGGYLNMEIDFDEYLEIYADEIGIQFRRALQNCK